MKMIFLGGMYPECYYDEVFKKSKGALSYAADKYQKNLIKGFNINCVNPPVVFSTYFVKPYPHYQDWFISERKWLQENQEIGTVVPFINFRITRQISRYASLKKIIGKYIANSEDEKFCIFLYSLDYAFLKLAHNLKKKNRNIITVAFVPDLPSVIASYSSKFDLYRVLTKKINLTKVEKYRKTIDGYVIMAEPMKEVLNIPEGKYCVVDGIFDGVSSGYKNNKFDDIKRIVYTGALNENSGVNLLLKAFAYINEQNYRLIIAGKGSLENTIQCYARNDNRIVYLGGLSQEEVRKIQLKADVLVNPRPTSGIDASYSFPSKTIEYLSTGIPVLMFSLLGVSNEYYKYVFRFSSEKPEEMAQDIVNVCTKDVSEISNFGEKAVAFLREKKTYQAQTKKICEFIDTLSGEKV